MADENLRLEVVDPGEEIGYETDPASSDSNDGENDPLLDFPLPRYTLEEVNVKDIQALNVLAEKHSLYYESPTPYTCFRIEPIDVPSRSGVVIERFYKKLMREGSDNQLPENGEFIYIYYTGYYCSENEFIPFSPIRKGQLMQLGLEHVMVGVDHAVATMKRGEAALFILPPTMTNGPAQKEYDVIPMMKTYFEIEVLDLGVTDVSPRKDGSILKKIIKMGIDSPSINDGAVVKVRVAKFEKRNAINTIEHEYIFGEYMYYNVPKAVDLALSKMKLSEMCALYASTKYGSAAQDSDLSPEFDPPLEYCVNLLHFERAPEVWELNSDQKYEHSLKLLEKGRKFFQDGNITLALKQFKKIVTFLEDEPGVTVGTEEMRESCLISAYNNCACCYLKLSKAPDAKRFCDKVLEKQPNNEKALYRRGKSYMMLKEHNLACDDFKRISQVNPLRSKESAELVAECRKLAEEQMQREKSTYANMFQKFAEQDEAERRRRQRATETGTWDQETSPASSQQDQPICSLDVLHDLEEDINRCLTGNPPPPLFPRNGMSSRRGCSRNPVTLVEHIEVSQEEITQAEDSSIEAGQVVIPVDEEDRENIMNIESSE